MNDEQIALGGTRVPGFDDQAVNPPTVQASPWKMTLTSSMLGAFTGWALDNVSKRVFRGLS